MVSGDPKNAASSAASGANVLTLQNNFAKNLAKAYNTPVLVGKSNAKLGTVSSNVKESLSGAALAAGSGLITNNSLPRKAGISGMAMEPPIMSSSNEIGGAGARFRHSRQASREDYNSKKNAQEGFTSHMMKLQQVDKTPKDFFAPQPKPQYSAFTNKPMDYPLARPLSKPPMPS